MFSASPATQQKTAPTWFFLPFNEDLVQAFGLERAPRGHRRFKSVRNSKYLDISNQNKDEGMNLVQNYRADTESQIFLIVKL